MAPAATLAATASAPPDKNGLLASLPDMELRALASRLDWMRLPRGRPLCEPGDDVAYLYFPTSGIVSLVHIGEGGTNTELALVGCEGVVGLSALLGGQNTLRAVVQASGHAYRLPAAQARARFAEGGAFQRSILRYADTILSEVAQTAVCNLRHSVAQQLCRWLLLCLDRLPGHEIHMTHELIASVLGVRRQGITEAAKKLEARRIISYYRGRIRVLDRGALERSACECYAMMNRLGVSRGSGAQSPPLRRSPPAR